MLLFFRERSELLQRLYSVRIASAQLSIRRSTAFSYLQKLHRIGLIGDDGKGNIIVYKARVCHPKLKWKDFPIRGTNGESAFPHTGIDQREERREIISKEELSQEYKHNNLGIDYINTKSGR